MARLLRPNRNAAAPAARAVQCLFENGEQGAWYDPSYFSTLYQDSAGTTPVTAVGQPVGLLLDKRLGLVRGAEVFNPLDFTAGWTVGGGGAAVDANSISASSAGGLRKVVLTVGVTYEIVVNATASISTTLYNSTTSTNTVLTFVSGTTQRAIFTAVDTSLYFRLAAAGTLDINSISVRELPGNHSTQSTAASRPTLSARVNQAANTDKSAISNGTGLWFHDGNGGGALSTGTFTQTTANVLHRFGYAVTLASGVSYKLRFRLKGNGTRYVYLNAGGPMGVSSCIDTQTGAVVAGTAATSISLAVDGYVEGVFTGNGSGVASAMYWQAQQTAAVGDQAFAGNGTDQMLIDQLDLRTAADAALAIPAYQRVNTATDYDTNGFPFREDFDGVDDSLSSASGGGSTTGFFYCAAIRVAGGAGATRRLWNDYTGNTGYAFSINATDQLQLSAGTGATRVSVASTGAVSVGGTYVVTAWHDGVNLYVQVNQGAIDQAACGAAVAGTASFSEGKDNGAGGNFFNGGIFARVYRAGPPPSASQRAALQRLIAQKAGVTL